MTSRPPPRLHVIPATSCNKALVLRRGPTMHVASCLWDRVTGEVELGQWLKARIFEHRSDLSPDGRHMIIFARRGGKAWTAISQAPWLTALAYYPQDGTWFGGGAFTPEGDVFLNGSSQHDAMPGGLRIAPPDAYPSGTDGFHMGGFFPAMMQARGWQHDSGTRYDVKLSKEVSRGWRLHLRFEHGFRSARSVLDHVYTLEREGQTIRCDGWEWAERWKTGLQVAAKGALWFVPFTKPGLGEPQMIHDFNDMTFESREAPYEGIHQ